MADQGRRRGHDAPRAAPVAPERCRSHAGKAGQESLQARSRRAAKAIDRLVVVADHERVRAAGDQLDQPLLGEVEVLVLVDQHVRIARGVAPEQRRIPLEHADRQKQEVVEIEQPLPPALALVGSEEPDARAHEVRSLRVVGRRCPALEAAQRHQLLLHALEHLERRRDEVVRPLVAGQRDVADAPHQLPGEDPPVGAGEDAKAGRHTD